jgi:predicted metalloprotease with PDZ domain
MRDYLVSVEDLLEQMSYKLVFNDGADQNLSLTRLSKESVERQDQYVNIYSKGAVVATLLDIKLLELSRKKKGTRSYSRSFTKIWRQ